MSAGVGGGPVISFMDGSTIYDRDFIKLACAAAVERGIPYQMKQAVAEAMIPDVFSARRRAPRRCQ